MEARSIFFLWAEITGYVYSVFLELNKYDNCNVYAYHWGKTSINSSNYIVPGENPSIIINVKGENDHKKILYDLINAKPIIIVVSGWMDTDYIKAVKKYKKIYPSVKIISGLDAQWNGSLRQYIGSFYYRLKYRQLYEFIWVSGKPQYAFALHLGYTLNNILTDLYSCDTNLFNHQSPVSKRFIYVGRFIKIKFIDGLLKAYNALPEEIQKSWQLFLIGDGDQLPLIERTGNSNIKIFSSLQPFELKKELSKGGVGLLTSHRDKWGVVVHEYVSMGLPIILSSGVGAATEFLIPNYNGFIFKKGDWKSLNKAMKMIASCSVEELELFSNNSFSISKRINPSICASSLLSCLNR